MSLSSSLVLVRGLRDSASEQADWKELVTNAILGKWPVPNRSRRTIDAEDGLNITGTPYYFYVERTLRPYVFAIFLHRQTASIDLESLHNKSDVSRDGATPLTAEVCGTAT